MSGTNSPGFTLLALIGTPLLGYLNYHLASQIPTNAVRDLGYSYVHGASLARGMMGALLVPVLLVVTSAVFRWVRSWNTILSVAFLASLLNLAIQLLASHLRAS